MTLNITPAEAKKMLEEDSCIKLIDVREKWEFDIAKLENSELMPLSEFQIHFAELKKENKYIIICHYGNRSLTVTNFLIKNGFINVFNLAGGIDKWSSDIDKSIPVY